MPLKSSRFQIGQWNKTLKDENWFGTGSVSSWHPMSSIPWKSGNAAVTKTTAATLGEQFQMTMILASALAGECRNSGGEELSGAD